MTDLKRAREYRIEILEQDNARLREENKQLRRAYESDAEAIEQAAENASLRAELGRVREGWKREHDELVPNLKRLRWSLTNAHEDNDVLKAQRDTLLAALEESEDVFQAIVKLLAEKRPRIGNVQQLAGVQAEVARAAITSATQGEETGERDG